MSTPESKGDWKVKGLCPHGLTVLIDFEDLGYLMKPKDSQCDQHLAVSELEDRRLPNRPGWFTLWRETRRARKALRGL